ncbi:hypothetical protein VDG1235_894 [Verrucomicrobiia bacterium DG1235]|nr:hypothetical protein VDG1235_894 [Verrucomicrobiae bacterium DG1235]
MFVDRSFEEGTWVSWNGRSFDGEDGSGHFLVLRFCEKWLAF